MATAASPTNIREITGEFIFAKNKHYEIKKTTAGLQFSIDGGITYSTPIPFSYPNHLFKYYSAILFDNGKFILLTNRQLFIGDCNSPSITETFVKNLDNSKYVLHKPVNPEFPGNYFVPLQLNKPKNNCLMWGNYGNVNGGATPVNIYYTDDYGANVYAIYKFGQNPANRDNGSTRPSNSGTLLGDPSNATITRHVHSCDYSTYTEKFYVNTGDELNQANTSHWFEIFFNKEWKINKISTITPSPANRFVLTTFEIKGRTMYFLPEPTNMPGDDFNRAIFKCNVDEYADESKHVKIIDLGGIFFGCSLRVSDNQQYLIATVSEDHVWNSARFLLLAKRDSETTWTSSMKEFEGRKFVVPPFDSIDSYLSLFTQFLFYDENDNSFLLKPGDDLLNNI